MANCPKCGNEGRPEGDRNYYCHGCKIVFDDDPDEGGTHSDWDASRRLEREEERRQQRLDRLAGRDRKGGRG